MEMDAFGTGSSATLALFPADCTHQSQLWCRALLAETCRSWEVPATEGRTSRRTTDSPVRRRPADVCYQAPEWLRLRNHKNIGVLFGSASWVFGRASYGAISRTEDKTLAEPESGVQGFVRRSWGNRPKRSFGSECLRHLLQGCEATAQKWQNTAGITTSAQSGPFVNSWRRQPIHDNAIGEHGPGKRQPGQCIKQIAADDCSNGLVFRSGNRIQMSPSARYV